MKIDTWKPFILLALLSVHACSADKEQETAKPIEPQAPVIQSGDPVNGQALSKDCVSCHGPDGAGSNKGAPFIAGQKIDYFKASMNAYRAGTRKHEDMQNLAATLDDSMINDIAAYYSQLDTAWDPLPYRPKARPQKVISKADIAAGKKLSQSCLGCHGETGNSIQPGIPSLAGLQPEYLVSALSAYFNGNRQDPIMKNFMHAIDKNEMSKLAAYFNSLERVAIKATVAGNKKKGQAIADEKCAGCHGPSGNSASSTMPSLSAQNAEYLLKVLNDYQSGPRKNNMMRDALKGISTRSFKDIVAYYAAQSPERYDPAKVTEDTGFDPIGKGEKLAQSCNGCHGKNGNSNTAGTPSLTGLHPEYIKKAIASYQNGERTHALMKSFVQSIGLDDSERISLYYATREPAASAQSIKGDSAAAEAHIGTCNGCHGSNGNSTQATTPSLAGQDPSYVVSALKAYQSGKRTHPDMQNAVKDLKASDFNNIAAYYVQQTAIKPAINIPDPPPVLSAKCDRCHGENGFSAVLDIPRIGGQIESYLLESMMHYKNKTRDHAVMYAMSDALSNLEIKAISRYYSDQKP